MERIFNDGNVESSVLKQLMDPHKIHDLSNQAYANILSCRTGVKRFYMGEISCGSG